MKLGNNKFVIIKILFSFIILNLHFCFYSDLAQLSGKCEKEKKKQRLCEVRNLIACELSPSASEYRKSNIDICTNPDGGVFLLIGLCQGNLSYECGGPQSSSQSSSKKN